MTHVQVTEGPKGPCDRPAPPPGSSHATHSHTDGRVCLWQDEAWVTVAAVPKSDFEVSVQTTDPEPAPPEPVDQKAVGAYPKFAVQRKDGRDRPGGDREEAPKAYFVLDPIYDPAARPALALYATLVRQMGYEKLADDLDHNLAILGDMTSDALAATGEPVSGRVVATWTYPLLPENYTAGTNPARMAQMDQHLVEQEQVGPEDTMRWARGEISVRVMPNG